MKASIVILSYNQSYMLQYSLYALSKQETKYNFEIIISDDGSNLENIQKIFELIKKYDNLEIYFTFQQDRGFNASMARNNGIRMARGDIIILLDGDIIVRPDFIESHMNIHLNKNNILVWTEREFKNLDEVNYETLYDKTKDKANFLAEEIETKKRKNRLPWHKIISFNISFKKKEYTYFNENFHSYGLEDYCFGYKLYKIYGYEIVHLPIKVIHIDEKGHMENNCWYSKDINKLEKFYNLLFLPLDEFKENSAEFFANISYPDKEFDSPNNSSVRIKLNFSELCIKCNKNVDLNDTKNLVFNLTELFNIALKRIKN